MKNHVISNTFKASDNEGRIHLGHEFSDKQWQMTEFDNGCILLVPIGIATDEEAMATFAKVFAKHKKTMDALK